jgi:hypothetical protein
MYTDLCFLRTPSTNKSSGKKFKISQLQISKFACWNQLAKIKYCSNFQTIVCGQPWHAQSRPISSVGQAWAMLSFIPPETLAEVKIMCFPTTKKLRSLENSLRFQNAPSCRRLYFLWGRTPKIPHRRAHSWCMKLCGTVWFENYSFTFWW